MTVFSITCGLYVVIDLFCMVEALLRAPRVALHGEGIGESHLRIVRHERRGWEGRRGKGIYEGRGGRGGGWSGGIGGECEF